MEYRCKILYSNVVIQQKMVLIEDYSPNDNNENNNENSDWRCLLTLKKE